MSSDSGEKQAQSIALAMRDFVNDKQPDESKVYPFVHKIGGYETIFGLVVAISDPLHLRLVRRVLDRLFDLSTEGGRVRMMDPNVIAFLLAGMRKEQPKHVRLVALENAHRLVTDEETLERLLENDMFHHLLDLLSDDDVEVTEELMQLLRKIGRTQRGVQKLFEYESIERMMRIVIGGTEKEVVEPPMPNGNILQPFMRIMRAQAHMQSAADGSASSSSAPIPRVDSILLMRVLTLLTQVACGSRPQYDTQGPQPLSHSQKPIDHGAVVGEAWQQYTKRGIWDLLMYISSIKSGEEAAGQDILVQLNGLELMEEVVRVAPAMNDAFALHLTRTLLAPAIPQIRTAASSRSSSSRETTSVTLLPTSSFISVGLLRVLNRMASVSAERQLHSWYESEEVLLFLSTAFNEYDDEAVQNEAIDLITTLATFPQGLRFFSQFTSTLPKAATDAPSATSAYLTTAYADSVTPILLCQVMFFVHGSNYSTGLRQLAALHGIAKMLLAPWPKEEQEQKSSNAADDAKSSDGAAAAADSISSNSSSTSPSTSASISDLLSTFFSYLHRYHPHHSKSGVEVLWTLVRQPFEDIREAVWKVVLGLTIHTWGVGLISQTGGFIEYLLDRKTEFHVSGSQAKYDIIRSLAQNPALNTYCLPATSKLVHEYVREGAHYTPLTVGVKGPVSGARS